jgi:lipoprotein-releasing system ATP-binding protein
VNETSGTSFLIVTHDPRLAQRCDRIIELVDGNIASDQANVNVRRPHRDLNIASAAHSG